MARITSWLSTIALCLASVSARAISRRAVPIVPDLDPFYTPPAGYASTEPGTILRNRTIDASFFGLLPDGAQGYQLLFRTTATNGTPIATVTTIFKPYGTDLLDRFVSFQTAYDSSATICDPSYNYQLGADQTDFIITFEELLLEGLLIKGYIVASTDYEGPDAAFGAGHLAGMGVLDGMRAVNNFASTLGLTTDTPKIVGYGYSGGAIATGWAASLQSAYAPALDIIGWAAGGTPANLTGTLEYLNGAVFSGFLPAAFSGLLKPSAYAAQLETLFESIITTYGKTFLDLADTQCATTDIIDFPLMSVLSTDFQTLGAELPYNAEVKAVLDQTIMGLYSNQTPTVPVYMYHAAKDEIIPYANASTLATTWCDDGATVHFTTYESGGHLTTEVLGFVGAVEFIDDAFAGDVASGCTRTTSLANTLDPIALGVDLEPLLIDLIQVLATLGEGDVNVIDDLSILEDDVSF